MSDQCKHCSVIFNEKACDSTQCSIHNSTYARRLKATIERLQAKIERLRAIVDKLPITADGVSLVPIVDACYAVINGNVEKCYVTHHEDNRGWIARPVRWDMDRNIEIDYCYSTREAAEAAKEAK
jgi:hypothetical protein